MLTLSTSSTATAIWATNLKRRDPPRPFGGSFENRTRFLREVVAGIRASTSRIQIGVRLSAFDFAPYRPDPEQSEGSHLGPGIPEDFASSLPYRHAFGGRADNPIEYDLADTARFVSLLRELDIRLLNVTAGSPYYNPHIQRPALFPPSDGYQPPEDPLVGCDRQIQATAELKAGFPDMVVIGTGYSYLQEYLPHVAQWGGGQRQGGRRRPRPDGAGISDPAARHADPRQARPEENLPHLQRLHDGTSQRTRIGLLPARPRLQESARGQHRAQDQGVPLAREFAVRALQFGIKSSGHGPRFAPPSSSSRQRFRRASRWSPRTKRSTTRKTASGFR